MSDGKTLFEDIVDRAEKHAQSLGMKLNPKLKFEIRKITEEVMNEEIKTGRDGEPIVFANNPEVNKILNNMQEGVDDACRNRQMQWADLPPFCLPNMSNHEVVEVAPGVMVSQKLINEAVRHTSNTDDEQFETYVEEIEKVQIAKQKDFEELKQDLSTSKQIVQAMMDRARQPVNTHEKFVSYDAMPSPLQRVVKAYIEAAAANKELDEAVKALNLAPMVISASEVKAD